MPRKLDNYLRYHRKRIRLSQKEVAFLLGSSDDGKVSRHERFDRRPSVRAVLAYEVLFGVPTRDLFAGYFDKVERVTLGRVELLIGRLGQQPQSRVTMQKIAVLRRLLEDAAMRRTVES